MLHFPSLPLAILIFCAILPPCNSILQRSSAALCSWLSFLMPYIRECHHQASHCSALLLIVYEFAEVQRPWISQEPICGVSSFDFIFSNLLIRLFRKIGLHELVLAIFEANAYHILNPSILT